MSLFSLQTGEFDQPYIAPPVAPVVAPTIGERIAGFAKAGEPYANDLGLLKLMAQFGANLGGKDSVAAAIGNPVAQFVSQQAQTKANQAGVGATPPAPAPAPAPTQPAAPENHQVKALLASQKAISEALLHQAPPPVGAPAQTKVEALPPSGSSINPPIASAVTSVAPAEAVAPAAVPVTSPDNAYIKKIGEMVAAGPMPVGDPFESIRNISPWEMGALASPEAVDSVFKNTIAAAAQRHLSRQEANTAYKNTVDAYKEAVAAGKKPYEIAKMIEEIQASQDKRTGVQAGNEELAKKKAEIQAKNLEIEIQAQASDNVPLPAAVTTMLQGTGIKTVGGMYRQFRTVDPKLINEYLKDYVSMQNSMRNSSAIERTSIASLVPYYNSQVNSLRKAALDLSAKVERMQGETDSAFLARSVLNPKGALQPAEHQLLQTTLSQLQGMEAKAANLVGGLEGNITGGSETKDNRRRPVTAPASPAAPVAPPTFNPKAPFESKDASGRQLTLQNKPVYVQGGYIYSTDGTLLGKR